LLEREFDTPGSRTGRLLGSIFIIFLFMEDPVTCVIQETRQICTDFLLLSILGREEPSEFYATDRTEAHWISAFTFGIDAYKSTTFSRIYDRTSAVSEVCE
jgi:hypothetical protein